MEPPTVPLTGIDEEKLDLHVVSLNLLFTTLTEFGLQITGNILVHDSDGSLALEATKDAAVFNALKRIVVSGLSIVWLTNAVNQGSNAFSSMAHSFLKAIRTEQATSKISPLDVNPEVSAEAISPTLNDLLASLDTKDSGIDTDVGFIKIFCVSPGSSPTIN
ncbi:hypothetical protein GQ43DRAFT_469345 [Delitschia confertaspora ATCC 74209]|uniref:Uncharacterized protein n=1 Tax=Delitschia confertaspora ATCC 74209 TaxID=1513339 RepID=A0A9P4JTJ1_9PLEO|nr:hypothetical protein GQ43DRAFT_469345 [Delitschia confertaspora ATCC 74209]